MKMNIDFYGLYLTSYNIEVNTNDMTEVTFTMRSVNATTEPQLEALTKDMSVLNAIRSNNDPAVKDQWEQLLTTVALTNGRNVPEVLDSMAKGGKTGNSN